MQLVYVQLQDLKQQFASKLTKYVFIKHFHSEMFIDCFCKFQPKLQSFCFNFFCVHVPGGEAQALTVAAKDKEAILLKAWVSCPGWWQNAADIGPFKRGTADTPYRIHGTGIFIKYVSGMIYTLSNVCFKCVYMYTYWYVFYICFHMLASRYFCSQPSVLWLTWTCRSKNFKKSWPWAEHLKAHTLHANGQLKVMFVCF